jgi:hypothetical protein
MSYELELVMGSYGDYKLFAGGDFENLRRDFKDLVMGRGGRLVCESSGNPYFMNFCLDEGSASWQESANRRLEVRVSFLGGGDFNEVVREFIESHSTE